MSPVYEEERGKPPVWVYIAGGFCGCLVIFFLIPLLFGIGAGVRSARQGSGRMIKQQAESAACKANLTQIAVGLQMYTNEWNGYLPPADSWCDALMMGKAPVNAGAFHCPLGGTAYSYAFNDKYAGKKLADIKDHGNAALVFDSPLGTKNAHEDYGSLATSTQKFPHPNGRNVAFADGSIRPQ